MKALLAILALCAFSGLVDAQSGFRRQITPKDLAPKHRWNKGQIPPLLPPRYVQVLHPVIVQGRGGVPRLLFLPRKLPAVRSRR